MFEFINCYKVHLSSYSQHQNYNLRVHHYLVETFKDEDEDEERNCKGMRMTGA